MEKYLTLFKKNFSLAMTYRRKKYLEDQITIASTMECLEKFKQVIITGALQIVYRLKKGP